MLPTRGGCPLSVVIPFYNETAFVRAAVESVLSQGISGLDVIVVNDNPGVFAPEAFSALGVPDCVRVVHQPRNLGLSAARNAGMAVAEGQHIAFLDADDYYISGGLRDMLAYAQHSGADMTHAQTFLTQVGSPRVSVLARDRRLFADQKVRPGLLGLEAAQFITSSWSSLYRADFLRDAGLTFDEEQRKFEDRLFVLSSVTRAGTIAQLGRPIRVWRRRAGSISTSAPDAEVMELQLKLLEKCMAEVIAWRDRVDAPPRFLKREVFNTLSRLIWDVGILPALADGSAPAGMAQRVQALIADERLGQGIFEDPVIRKISRVGEETRFGRVTRGDFFNVVGAMADGDFAAAYACLTGISTPVAARTVPDLPDLILHLGLHKTGSTAIQSWCAANPQVLSDQGVLFPRTGLPGPEFNPTRDGGLPGHQMLLNALRSGAAEDIWQGLAEEIKAAGAERVLLSCENFLMPLRSDRDVALPALLEKLKRFRSIRLLAFVRRPDVWIERFYREVVSNGNRGGARTIEEFLVDYQGMLTDFAGLFAPFEAIANGPVRLIDYDAAARGDGVLRAFAKAAGLDLPLGGANPAPQAVYATPDRATIQAARTINMFLTNQTRREDTLRDFFRMVPVHKGPDFSFLSPELAAGVRDSFQAQSAVWAAERGYHADLSSRPEDATWQPLAALPNDVYELVLRCALRTETEVAAPVVPIHYTPPQMPPTAERGVDEGAPILQMRLRPWAARLFRRVRRP